MGEIKSTWDIVMEKTKGLEITSRDRERIKKRDLTSRINAIFHRYMDAQGDHEYLKKELEGLQGDERAIAERELLIQLLDTIDLSKDNGTIITGIETLKGKSVARTLEKLHLLASEYKASRDEGAREIEGILRRRLAAAGIYGSAVQPNLEGKRDWIELMEGLKRDFGNRLEALKEELLNS
jgi:hypothetical protein